MSLWRIQHGHMTIYFATHSNLGIPMFSYFELLTLSSMSSINLTTHYQSRPIRHFILMQTFFFAMISYDTRITHSPLTILYLHIDTTSHILTVHIHLVTETLTMSLLACNMFPNTSLLILLLATNIPQIPYDQP